MRLEIRVPVKAGQEPTDDAVLAHVHAAIAAKATAWTEPVHIATDERDDGTRLLTFATDAQPKPDPSIVTTSNVAPALLPPHVA